MKKFSILILLFLAFCCQVSAQSVMLWEKNVGSYSFFASDNNTRSLAYNPATNHLLVASRTGAANIYIINPVNGDSVGVLDMTGVSGGTYPINYVRVTSAGVIYCSNLILSGAGFKLYRWENESAVPTVAYEGFATGRVGDIIAVSGSGTGTVIYASGSTNTKIHVFTSANGINFTETDSITVAAGLARGGISPVTTGVNSDLWVNGAGTHVSLINSTGTVLGSIDGGVISSGWHNVVYFAPNTGKKYVAVVGKNEATEGRQIRMYDVTTNVTYPPLFAPMSLTNTYNTNANATGDGAIVDNEDGTFTVYSLVTNNGFAAFKTNFLTIAQAREDLDHNNIPDRLNDTVTIAGVAISPNYQTVHHSYYFWDGTAGITEYLAGTTLPVINLGDKYRITGKIGQFNGLTQIQPFDTASFTFISDSNALPDPILLTIAQYKADPEAYEGSLVGFVSLSKVGGSWPSTGSSATLKISDGIDTVDLRIDSDTDIDGQPEPVWPKDIVGLASQYIFGGVTGGLQILPRYYALDFLPANTLPVELVSFAANVIDDNVVLSWTTSTEKNNSGFEVQRSIDNQTFVPVGFVIGKGTTTESQSYSFTDKAVQSGTEYFYRLKQVDHNGTYSISAVVNVSISSPVEFALNQNYPNPFNPSTSISFSIPVNAKVSIKLYNILGREVVTLIENDLNGGSYDYRFNLHSLSSGVYFYTIEAVGADGSVYTNTRKMTLLK